MQTNGKTRMTRWFNPEVHVLTNTLVPVVSTIHLVVQQLIGITHQAHMLGASRTYPQVRVAQWHVVLVLHFVAPMGRAWYPSQILLWSTVQSSCVLHDGELATKPSRRWQPPRVTSTIGLQQGHLVPLDEISQCNCRCFEQTPASKFIIIAC